MHAKIDFGAYMNSKFDIDLEIHYYTILQTKIIEKITPIQDQRGERNELWKMFLSVLPQLKTHFKSAPNLIPNLQIDDGLM